jgi:hypothetical protein
MVLLINLLTTHIAAISSLVGPLHGTAYLAVITATLLTRPPAPSGARLRAVIPAIGGLLALWHLRDRSISTHASSVSEKVCDLPRPQ